jgi:hypothetical protein
MEGSDVVSNTISPVQLISSRGALMVHDASKRRPNAAMYLARNFGMVLLCKLRLFSMRRLVDFLDGTKVSTPFVRNGATKAETQRAKFKKRSMDVSIQLRWPFCLRFDRMINDATG